MTLNPDRLLMEHVFRPFVERTKVSGGNFHLARFCLLGTMVFELMVFLLLLTHWRTVVFWPQVCSSVAVGVVVVALNRFSYVSQDLARRGFAPCPYVWPYVATRTFALVAILSCVMAGLILPFLHSLDFMFGTLVLASLTSGIYFLHCVLPPRVRPAIHRFRMGRRERIA